MILQLNPPIPVITPKGWALAHMVIDNGIEHDLHWVCFQNRHGECWTWKNQDIRAQKNITQGREYISPFYNPDDVAFHSEEEEEEEQYEDIESAMMIDELRKEIEESTKGKLNLIAENSSKDATIKSMKVAIMDLHDQYLQLLRHKRINKSDVNDVVNLLKRTGVADCDIKILGNQKE